MPSCDIKKSLLISVQICNKFDCLVYILIILTPIYLKVSLQGYHSKVSDYRKKKIIVPLFRIKKNKD